MIGKYHIAKRKTASLVDGYPGAEEVKQSMQCVNKSYSQRANEGL